MIDLIRIENFKCFAKLALPLSNLTLLSGFNATGKSTVYQPLLLLAQALRKGGESPYLPLNGELLRLGSAGDVVRDGEGGRDLLLGVTSEKAGIAWSLRAEERESSSALRITHVETMAGGSSVSFEVNHGMRGLLPQQESRADVLALRDTLRHVNFVSAVRLGTADVFPIPDDPDASTDMGTHGEYAPWWFDQFADSSVEKRRRHPSDSATTVRRQLNAWASTLFPGAQANVQRVPGTSLLRLELRVGETKWRKPSNTGYGLTYAFPILVAGLTASAGQVMIIDSPEAHLHPKGQSEIGGFLAQVAASGVQVIIETHSDHVLNGVRIAAKSGQIDASDVSIHFFNPPPSENSHPAHVVSPMLDRLGNLSEWPTGFFDQAEKDLSSIAGWD